MCLCNGKLKTMSKTKNSMIRSVISVISNQIKLRISLVHFRLVENIAEIAKSPLRTFFLLIQNIFSKNDKKRQTFHYASEHLYNLHFKQVALK